MHVKRVTVSPGRCTETAWMPQIAAIRSWNKGKKIAWEHLFSDDCGLLVLTLRISPLGSQVQHVTEPWQEVRALRYHSARKATGLEPRLDLPVTTFMEQRLGLPLGQPALFLSSAAVCFIILVSLCPGYGCLRFCDRCASDKGNRADIEHLFGQIKPLCPLCAF